DGGLEIRLAPGWHIYWRTPGAAGLPPAITWQGSRNLKGAPISWPAPLRIPLDGLQSYGYEGTVVLPIALRLAQPGAPLHLRATVDYMVCRNICVPRHAVLGLALPSGIALPGPVAALIAAARSRVPGDLARLGLTLVRAAAVPAGARRSDLVLTFAGRTASLIAPDLFVEGLPQGAPGPPHLMAGDEPGRAILVLRGIEAPATVLAGRLLKFTLTDGPDRAATFAARPVPAAAIAGAALLPFGVLALAFLGGLILNVMPCVLPVLALKIMAVAGLAGAERRVARLELLTTAGGVLAGFAVLAAALIALKAAGAAVGWGIQFQQPWFLAAMTMVMVLFAADLWGWVTIAAPRSVAAVAVRSHHRSRRLSAFLAGAFATLLATSCSVPFVGTAVGFALARGPAQILAILFAMGLGLAAPYLLGAAAPGLVTLLPRPGQWMVRLARLFGVFLLGTAFWLLLVLLRAAGWIAAGSVAGLAVLLLGLLFWRHRFGGRHVALRRLSSAAASLALIGAIVVPGIAAAPPSPQAAAGTAWRPFTRAALAGGLADGKVVLVDVTAAWCLVCQVNAATVLDRAPVAEALAAPGVVLLRADWTRPDPAITRYLQSFGRYGVPLDVVYGPAIPAGIVLPDLVTSGEVLRALQSAAGARRAAER
ncbi:MAG TPA: protein-disulfide reductase DsbD domain-containing protein, partial [Acetobacteraceae bacterium]|nr:protein-disulfide reductase DsbD domain-containing protein [Acetobacteraceae bacterium]